MTPPDPTPNGGGEDRHALASVRQERDEYLSELVELREENTTLRARAERAEGAGTPEHLRSVVALLRESEATVTSLRDALKRQQDSHAAQLAALASLPDQIMAATYQWTPGEDESSLIERAFETAAIIARRALAARGDDA